MNTFPRGRARAQPRVSSAYPIGSAAARFKTRPIWRSVSEKELKYRYVKCAGDTTFKRSQDGPSVQGLHSAKTRNAAAAPATAIGIALGRRSTNALSRSR